MVRILAVILLAVLAGQAAAGDWSVRRDPFDPGVVARYRQILARDPYDADARGQLVRMYRRYRTLHALEVELAQAADRSSLIVRAELAHDRRDLEEARALLGQAAQLDASDARMWLLLGTIDRERGDALLARGDEERVVALAPPPAVLEPALRQLAELVRDAKDGDALEAAYDRLTALAPRDGQRWLDRGEAELAIGRPATAARSFGEAEARLATDPERRLAAIERRGDALAAARDTVAALDTYWRALDKAPRAFERELVGKIVDVSRRQSALPALAERLERQWPERSRGFVAWSTLGALHAELGDPERAITELQHAVRIAPTETDAARKLIALLDDLGRPREALAIATAAARAAPGDEALAVALAERIWPRDDAGALAMLRRAEARFAREPGTLSDIAKTYARHHRHDLSLPLRERIARLDPADDDLRTALVREYVDVGEAAGGVAAWRRVTRKPTAAGLTALGTVLYEHDAFREALPVFDEALGKDRTLYLAWRNSAFAAEALGDAPGAIDRAERALAVAPTDPTSRHLARHDVLQLLHRAIVRPDGASLWRQHLEKWAAAVEARRPDLVSGYLLLDAYHELDCDIVAQMENGQLDECQLDVTLFPEAFAALARAVPDDPDVWDALDSARDDVAAVRVIGEGATVRSRVVLAGWLAPAAVYATPPDEQVQLGDLTLAPPIAPDVTLGTTRAPTSHGITVGARAQQGLFGGLDLR